MNKALLISGSFIATMTAISVGSVGDTNSCGEINSWTAPVTLLVTMLIPTVLAYRAGLHESLTDAELRSQLIEMKDAFDADPPSTIGSHFQLASHYYHLVKKAKPLLLAAIEKLGE